MNRATRLEIILLIASYIAGIVGVGLAARLIVEAIGPHPALAEAVLWTICAAAGLGGFIAFAFLASRIEFLCRSYQVSLRDGPCYEEREASGERRRLAFDWFPLTQGYRARCVVRLPPRDRWEIDAPAWARGRRDEIAGRITKDLRSYEGWPALLMPDAPAADSTSDATVTSALMEAILEGCPEWAPYVIPGSETGHLDSVLLSVPPPEHPSHRLEVVYRQEAFEIGYECGNRGLRAAAEFGLAKSDHAPTILCVCEFLREMREGEMVVLVLRLDLLTRWRRRDGARYGAQFRSVSPASRYSRASVYEWRTERSQNAG